MIAFSKVLIYLSYFSVLIPLGFMIGSKKGLKPPLFKIILALLIASALSDLISYILIQQGYSSITVVNIYFTLQIFLLSYLYYHLLKNKSVISYAVPVYLIFKVLNTLFIQSLDSYQSWTRLAGAIVALTYAILYYKQIYEDQPTKSLRTFSNAWINDAVFFYFAMNLFLFVISNYVFTTMTTEIGTLYWSFHNINNIIKNVLFAVGIYYGAKNV